MAIHEVLIMAMTRMRSGICTAGFINRPHSESILQWVRPVKEFGSLLLGDMTDNDGRVAQVGDVVELNLLEPKEEPTHAEDWLTDFVRWRPRCIRRLEGPKRASFLAHHVDRSPAQVLEHHTRSLCLLRPQEVWASFSLDAYSGKYQARIGFRQEGLEHPQAKSTRGIPVTDLKWRALGRSLLAQENRGDLIFDRDALLQCFGAEEIYLGVGLSRSFKGQMWALIVGVHLIPDYSAAIDYENL